jgi:hypothetical protein
MLRIEKAVSKSKKALDNPVLPYNGTSGWSGSDTSEERALDQDSSGTTLKRQNKILDYLDKRGEIGATWKEIEQEFGYHHGTASGLLSTLHKTSHIARLTKRRSRCKIYVLPEYVGDNLTEKQGHDKVCHNCGAEQ